MEDTILTVPEMLRYRAEVNSDMKSFNFYDGHGFVSTITPQQIYTLSGKFACLLRRWGFQPGDVIANGLPNSPERVITDFGIIMAGCILTTCQVIEKGGRDFWHTANICKCCGVIIFPRSKNSTYQLFSSHITSHTIQHSEPPMSNNSNIAKPDILYHVHIPQAPNMQKIILCDRNTNCNNNKQEDRNNYSASSSLLDILQSMDYEEEFFEYDCLPSDLAFLAATSGTSGFNKLVPFTHEKVLSHGRSYKSSTSLLYFNDRPMGWMGGFPYDYLASGVRRVLLDKLDNQHIQSPGILWSTITSTHCAGAVLPPSELSTLIDHFQNNPPSDKLLFIATGGQPLKKVNTKAIGMLCRCMRVSYGSTEAGIVAIDTVTDHNTYQEFYCGVVKDEVQIKIMDREGKEVNNGMKGEIYLKCGRVMQRYYNLMDNNNSSSSYSNIFTNDDWYKTGDWGMLKDDRKLYCFGRNADVVSIASTLIYLSWPESILSKCPLIQACSVVGLEAGNGEVVFGACVVPKSGSSNLTARDVIDFFDSQMIDTEYRHTLKLSHVFICDKLPLLPTGKINKRIMKRRFNEKLSII